MCRQMQSYFSLVQFLTDAFMFRTEDISRPLTLVLVLKTRLFASQLCAEVLHRQLRKHIGCGLPIAIGFEWREQYYSTRTVLEVHVCVIMI